MPKTCEEIYITRIEGAIRGIKMGTKKPSDVDVTDQFRRLKPLNQMMWEDLKDKYDAQVRAYNQKNNQR